MRLIFCLMALLCGCSTPGVRCDAHLQPINAPAPGRGGDGSAHAPAVRRTP